MSAEFWSWLPFTSLAHLLVWLAVTLHCLRRRREATSALLWIFLAWALPFLGALLYLTLGLYRVPDKGWRKRAANDRFLRERRAREEAELPMIYWRRTHEAVCGEPDQPEARELDRAFDVILGDTPLLRGNRIEPLLTGDAAFPRMLEAIAAARHHIHLQSFIIGADEVGRRFFDALVERARNGVDVRVLYDRFGSTGALWRGFFRKQARRGGPRLQLVGWTQANPLKTQFQINLRNHRKLLVVDGRVAFTGGINLQAVHTTAADGNPAARDYHFELHGPIVQELQYAFLRDWYFMTDETPDVLLHEDHFPPVAPVGDACLRIINGGPSAPREKIADTYFAAFTSARRQILLVTPYFVPPPALLAALRGAALRGVDVRLVVPRDNNHFYAGWAGRALYEELLRDGVRIFERRPPFLHAKALLVDDLLAIVGTANLDVRSLRLNYETNLAVFDERFANTLKPILLEELAAADEILLNAWQQRSVRRRLMENFCHLLEPVL